MELPGSEYLFNLSILAITFASISVLVTVVRQIIGGGLTKVDIYLLTTFLSAGFVLSVAAILPSMIHLFGLGDQAVWLIASGAAAVLFSLVTLRMQSARKMFASMGLGRFTTVAFSALWLAVVILIINAAVPAIQGAGPYAAAVTLCLATVMWSFVRRIASLSRPDAQKDWDLTKD